ncbi:ankyrin repeat-containing domain protein [Whalleya microplaca]|nr:ankyrin repeat-containing domain protein [Whalleya microplaca]
MAYQTWAEGHGSTTFWLTGPPGSGKTVLASHILHLLQNSPCSSKSVFLSFSFNRWDVRRNTERSFLVSIVRQLLILCVNSFKYIRKVVQAMLEQRSISCGQLWSLLSGLLAAPGDRCFFLLISTLHHCKEKLYDKLMSIANKSSKTTLKLLITSSEPPEKPLKTTFHVVLSESKEWKDSVKELVETRVSRILKKRDVWSDFSRDIIEKLRSKQCSYADITVCLDILEHSNSHSSRAALAKELMPFISSSQQIFDMIVSRYEGKKLENQALNWVFHATRPLTVEELSVALALGSDKLEEDLQGLFCGLLKVVNDHVYFAHPAFWEYLASREDLLTPHFHTLVTKTCLTYMEMVSKYQRGVDSGISEIAVNIAFGFLDYVDLYWHWHWCLEPALDELTDLNEIVNEVLSSKPNTLASWLHRYELAVGWESNLPSTGILLSREPQQELIQSPKALLRSSVPIPWELVHSAILTAIRTGNMASLNILPERTEVDRLSSLAFIAAEFGLVDIIRDTLGRMTEAEISTMDHPEKSILLHAVKNSHAPVVEILLRQPDSPSLALNLDSEQNTALHLAARLGNASTLSAMQEARPNDFKEAMTMKNKNGDCPLHLAIRAGDFEAFNLILEATGSSNMTSSADIDGLPISVRQAAEKGRLEILKELMKYEGNIAAYHRDRNVLLGPVVSAGHCDVLAWLLEHLPCPDEETTGGEVANVADEKAQEWIEEAITNGHIETTIYLLGRMPNMYEEQQHIWMTRAVDTGRLDMVETLVGKGLMLELDGLDTYNPFFDSCIHLDCPDLIRYLVNAGQKIQWDADNGENHLHYAITRGKPFCLRELLRAADTTDFMRRNVDGIIPIELAVGHGKIRETKEFLRWAETHQQDDQGWKTPSILFHAIGNYSHELVELLLENFWDPNSMDDNKDYPLHVAARLVAVSVVKVLLEHGSDPNALNRENQAPIHLIISDTEAHRDEPESIVAIFKMLLPVTADLDVVDGEGMTPLHQAVKLGDTFKDIVQLLLCSNSGLNTMDGTHSVCKMANVDKAAPQGWTALHFAHSAPSITEILLKKTSNVNPKTEETFVTPLMLAVESANVDVVSLLLKAGAAVNARDKEGRTALHYIGVASGSADVVDLLLGNGADVNARDVSGATPLFNAVSQDELPETEETVKRLLQKGKEDPNIFGGTFHSPLQIAVGRGSDRMINALLAAKAEVNIIGGEYGSVFHAAARRGCKSIVKTLLEHGVTANIKARPYGTPLHGIAGIYAPTGQVSEEEWMELIKLLLENGASVEDKDENGQTPLMAALSPIKVNNLDGFVARMLLEEHANPNVQDAIGATVLHRAVAYWGKPLVELLLRYEADPNVEDRCGRGVLYWAAMSITEDTLEKFTLLVEALPEAQRSPYLSAALPPAVAGNRKDLIEFILKYGRIDVNATDRNGWTGLDVARAYNFADLEHLLREYGAESSTNEKRETIPSRWNQFDKQSSINVSEDGLEVWQEGLGFDNPYYMGGAVRADHCFFLEPGRRYYEVEVITGGDGGLLAIGVCRERSRLDALSGWDKDSWGYHGDEVGLYFNHITVGVGIEYGHGSVIGVIVDSQSKTVSFTKNGEYVGSIENVYGQLYPVVSFLRQFNTIGVRANFGATPFKYPVKHT